MRLKKISVQCYKIIGLLLLLFIISVEADAGLYRNYTLVSLDVSAYADGGSHLLRFESTTYANDGTGVYKITNFWVDDICVNLTTPNGASTAMPWIPLLLLDE